MCALIRVEYRDGFTEDLAGEKGGRDCERARVRINERGWFERDCAKQSPHRTRHVIEYA